MTPNLELETLRDVVQRLDRAGIAYMLTGSFAMNHYAQPRMTRDIDLVAALEPSDVERIVDLFDGDYYVDRNTVRNAVARRSTFNLIHFDSVVKIDFIVLKADSYRREEFARRREVIYIDIPIWIVSREDLILSKLYWAKDSRSELQLRDARNLLASDCDMDYLRDRAGSLGVSDLLEEALHE